MPSCCRWKISAELLGAVSEFGVHVDMDTLTLAEMQRAHQAGWALTSGGADSILAILARLDNFVDFQHFSLHGRCIRAFGHLYRWLLQFEETPDLCPLFDLFRGYVAETQGLTPGKRFMERRCGG